VGLLCLPTLFGVAVFSLLGFLQQPSLVIDLGWLNGIAMATVFAAFLGAGYGPALIPVAAVITLAGQRRRSSGTGVSWLLVLLALAASILGYSWALDAVELP
jgi:hypothetical protein